MDSLTVHSLLTPTPLAGINGLWADDTGRVWVSGSNAEGHSALIALRLQPGAAAQPAPASWQSPLAGAAGAVLPGDFDGLGARGGRLALSDRANGNVRLFDSLLDGVLHAPELLTDMTGGTSSLLPRPRKTASAAISCRASICGCATHWGPRTGCGSRD